ncbi:hypothetical protein GRAQ_03567 [Rahnella aquatilis CIP 78.65 = ATCC 33071]|uniref:Uncharacterized protein n=1 Tax=Rahnella aquatilis (strain ATCC 33071 / DSM 4594 / JCM 1683 / NBRC 105701 / NCIMB 13365 / CIP 78.65) TaxID=745277 RepID=H2IUG1_RAHAC|nr:hypothetical protein [Rahnella aquatilis]AEX50555.1 hypothetical protein Rahaq2_0628 [Rahnella aquatilis CIP 78.65 = ATCC 33071]KFD01582.1 hypothetical protein GRAQ_03567 [Rahnella aquatilis CIP 78.65 = ATCC 33071]
MTYSVSVANKSGLQQNVAVYLGDSADNNDFSLVWWLKPINNSGNATFSWDENDYGLGWGNTSEHIDIGVKFSQGQDPTPAFPNVAGGDNVLPVSFNNAGFFSGVPYSDNKITNKLEISTDSSFTVSDSLTMAIALFINKLPTIIMQGSPNMTYYFMIPKLSYYLVVTDFKQGVVLPAMDPMYDCNTSGRSVGKPVKIAFGAGATNLAYTLDGSLNFIAN